MVPKNKKTQNFDDFWGRNCSLLPGNPSGKVGRLHPPPFLMGFPGPISHFDPQKVYDFGFLTFGTIRRSSIYGTVSALTFRHHFTGTRRVTQAPRRPSCKRSTVLLQRTWFLGLWWGGRAGNLRFGAASWPNPAPGGLGKGPGRGPARFACMFSPVDKSNATQ